MREIAQTTNEMHLMVDITGKKWLEGDKILGYLFIIGLILVLAIVLAISMRRDYKRIKKYLTKEKMKAKSFIWEIR